MTKSQRSVTKKLQLASLVRWLAILCFIKLSIFTMILLDIPFPAFLDKTTPPKPALTEKAKDAPKLEEKALLQKNSAQEPTQSLPNNILEQASKQALLQRPNTQDIASTPNLGSRPAPNPVRTSPAPENSFAPILNEEQLFSQGDIPLPEPLPAPIAEPGENAPQEVFLAAREQVRVPTLGNVTAAKAAASMPVPQTGPSASPFAPSEQLSPLTLPGAPEIPANLPRGGANGEMLPRQSPNMPMPKPATSSEPSSLQINSEVQELARQQQDMLMLKKQMDERLKELQDSEAKVKRMLEEAHGVEDKKLKSLIQMYANMKPKTAAKALEKMEERTACQILRGMTPKQSGDILSYTNPEVTAKLTERLSRMRMQ